MNIEQQQKAVAEILKIASANGIVCICWTIEDAQEALSRHLDSGLSDDETFQLSAELLDQYENQIEEQSIQTGWQVLEYGAQEIAAERLSAESLNKSSIERESNTLRGIS